MGEKAAASPSNLNTPPGWGNYNPSNFISMTDYYAFVAKEYANRQQQNNTSDFSNASMASSNDQNDNTNANRNDSDFKDTNSIIADDSSYPPLPPLPAPQKQAPSNFGPIRFHLNKQGNYIQTSPLNQNVFNNQNPNTNCGGMMGNKKKRNKKNKNKQNSHNNFNMNFQHGSASFQSNNSNANNSFNSPPLPLYTPIPDFSRPPPPLLPGLQSNSNSSQYQNQTQSPTKVPENSNNSAANTLNESSAPPTNSSNSEAAWPESLNIYVTKCYAKCKTEIDKDQIEICLKGKITSAATKGELWTKDWDNEPIPSVHSDSLNQPKSFLNAKKPVVTGQLSQYQNSKKTSPGLSNSLGARLGVKSAGNNKRPTPSKSPRRSRSSSRDSSPPHKRRSSEDDYYSLNSSTNNSNNTNNNKKNKKKNKKQKGSGTSAFYSEHGMIGGSVDGDAERLKKRLDRFKHSSSTSNTPSHATPSKKKRLSNPAPARFFLDDSLGTENLDLLNLHIVGTCRDLEKSFLRLTKAPLPSEVRPTEVLVFSLQNVKNKWKEKQDYFYACDQLKSIRQDLTVSFYCGIFKSEWKFTLFILFLGARHSRRLYRSGLRDSC